MQEILTRAIYTQQQQAAFAREIEARFGAISQILQEAQPIQLCVISDEDGTTLVTRGMGARTMNAPPDAHNRAELVIRLPSGWDVSRDDWPLRWLELLAQLPFEEDTWLGWGHTVPGGEPLAEDATFDAWLILDAFIPKRHSGGDPCEIRLPGGVVLRLYQLFALHPEELRFKLEHGAQALVEHLQQEKLLRPVLDIARANCFAPQEKQLLTDWDGPDRCLATERILADGASVGYCYREEPCGDWDSGWRFCAGDESDDYMADPACTGVYSLNCVANYDESILPILQTPAPCAFARGAGGLERVKSIL